MSGVFILSVLRAWLLIHKFIKINFSIYYIELHLHKVQHLNKFYNKNLPEISGNHGHTTRKYNT